MTESSESPDSDSIPPSEQLRTEEPKAPFGADEPNPSVVSDDTVEEQSSQDEGLPDKGGYVDRDPKTEMPAVPSAPDTQGEAPTHEGQPDDKERWAAE